MKKEDILKIRQLISEKEYDEIYNLYGGKVYRFVTPLAYKQVDKKNMLLDGRFTAVYEKHGEAAIKNHLRYIQLCDIENELGMNFNFVSAYVFERLKINAKLVKKLAVGVTIAGLALPPTFYGLLSNASDSLIEDFEITYESDLDEYNASIEEYAKYINSLGLNDLEIIIKVMNDMWSNIYGYKTPSSHDDIGMYRLSLYYNGYGVCRNMADDFTARMNAINPNYEAFNMNCYITSAEVNDIKRNIIETNDTVTDDDNNQNENDFDISKITGNHMVTCITLPNENILLIVDPTNPSIGVFQNGQVHMLSLTDANGIDTKIFGSCTLGHDYQEKCLKKTIQSYFVDIDIDYLIENYGIQSQNEVLKEIIKEYGTDKYYIKR